MPSRTPVSKRLRRSRDVGKRAARRLLGSLAALAALAAPALAQDAGSNLEVGMTPHEVSMLAMLALAVGVGS